MTQMAGVCYHNIDQILKFESDTKIIAIGTVLSIEKQQNYFSLVISDTTATAQATYCERQADYQQIKLPQVGDTIQLLGYCLTKHTADKKILFLGITLKRWRILTFKQELQLIQTIQNSRRLRSEKQIRKEVPMKEKTFSDQQMVDICSIIFSYTYTVLKNNKDLSSFLFAVLMIKQHSVCKQYANENKIHDKSMEEGLKRGLAYLVANGVIQQRLPESSEISLNKPDQYAIKRRYFERLAVGIEEFVYEKRTQGTTLEQVTRDLNEKMGKYSKEEWLFNWNFVQKVLMDLIDEFRIYKTIEKRLFPYSSA